MIGYVEVDSFTQKDSDPVRIQGALEVLGVHPTKEYMKTERRKFLKNTGMAGITLMTGTQLAAKAVGIPSISETEAKRFSPGKFTDYHNSTMTSDWQQALQILKPSQHELDRGLELHRESVVFDTYGFMPRAAVDGQVIADAVNDGASELELNDLREDHSMTRFV